MRIMVIITRAIAYSLPREYESKTVEGLGTEAMAQTNI